MINLSKLRLKELVTTPIRILGTVNDKKIKHKSSIQLQEEQLIRQNGTMLLLYGGTHEGSQLMSVLARRRHAHRSWPIEI